MDKLTKEEVLHVAKLARIEVTPEEIERYQVNLKKIFNEIDKINSIDTSGDILISPTNNYAEYRDSNDTHMISSSDVLKNAPKSSGAYIEVPVVINE